MSGSGHPRYDAQEQGLAHPGLQPAPSLAVLLSPTLIQWFVLFFFFPAEEQENVDSTYPGKSFPLNREKNSEFNNKKCLPACAWGNGAQRQ